MVALINSLLASHKGHSATAWFVASLVGGPLATVIILAFLDDRRLPPGSPRAVFERDAG